MKALVIVFLSLIAGAAAIMQAVCEDVAPPKWRGLEDSYLNEWTFDDSSNPATPDKSLASPDGAVALVRIGYLGIGWIDQLWALGNHTGYWDLGGKGGFIAVQTNEDPQDVPLKLVWVQVTYFRDISQPPSVGMPGGKVIHGACSWGHVVESVPTGGYWLVDQYCFCVTPSETRDWVYIMAKPAWGALVDHVIVDTLYIHQEPRINTISKSVSGVSLKWDSLPFCTYTVESRDCADTGDSEAEWKVEAKGVFSGATQTSWEDACVPESGCKFYRVRIDGVDEDALTSSLIFED